MSDETLDNYQQQVDALGQQLLDIIASVAVGELDVDVTIPEGIEIMSDLGIGLQFMIEDLKTLNLEQERSRANLERSVNLRTRDLENALRDLQRAQRLANRENWQEYLSQQKLDILVLEEGIIFPAQKPPALPVIKEAVENDDVTIKEGVRSSMAIPIHIQDEIIGVIGFGADDKTEWTEEQIETVESIVEQVGLALENQRLFDQTQTALAETDLLYQAAADLNTAQTFEEIIRVLKEFTIFGQGAKYIGINFFSSPWTKTARPKTSSVHTRWMPEEDASKVELFTNLALDDNLFADYFLREEKGTSIYNVDTEENLDWDFRRAIINQLNARSGLFLPLLVGGRWIGFFSALWQNPREFDEEDIRRAMAICSQASVAIQNLRSLEISEQRALESQKRSEELALINRIVASVSASFDLRQGLELVAVELVKNMEVDDVVVGLFNESRSRLVITADSSTVTGSEPMVGKSFTLSDNEVFEEIGNTQSPKTLTIRDVTPAETDFAIMMHDRHMAGMTLLPLIAANEIIGMVGLAIYEGEFTLSEDQMRLAETIIFQAATSIQNARLFEQTQAALTTTADLYQASAELNTAQSFTEILATLRRHTILGENAHYTSIHVFNKIWHAGERPETMIPLSQWTQVGQAGLDDKPVQLASWEKLEGLFSADQATVITDLKNDPRLDRAAQSFLVGKLEGSAALFTPLVSSGQWIGQLIATYDHAPNFSESALRRMMALAAQAAVAIQATRLLDETTRRARQLETASEIARDSSSNLEVDTLLSRAVNLIAEKFGFYHVSIYLREGKEAIVRASTKQEMLESAYSVEVKPDGQIVGRAISGREPIIVNDVSLSEWYRPHLLLPDTQSEISLPLAVGGEVSGAISVQSRLTNVFSEDEVGVLQILADQIAVALENAKFFELTQKAMEDIREADRLKTQFLANMSHELRTPLNSIIGFSRVIIKGIDGPINDVQREDLEAIHTSGQHLLSMINSILDISKIEAGKMELSIEETELDEIFKGVMSTAIGLVKEKPIKLVEDLPADLPTVQADATRVRQILINLIQNAAKFTDEGSITVSAKTTISPEGVEEVWISVKDTGIGIAKADQSKLFEPFTQVDDSPTRKTGGTGLGLSLCRRFTEMQGGRIGLDSDIGQGSLFWFTLPIAGDTPLIEELEEVIDVPFDGEKVILAIDDDPKIIDLYKRYLQPYNYHVVAMTEPTNAIDEVIHLKPHAITLDIMMPNKDGWEVLQELKTHPETREIPIIICSIIAEFERGYSLGATDYLVKPILENELIQALERLHIENEKDVIDILVIDDEESAFKLVEKALGNEPKFKLQFAKGGIMGLSLLNSTEPDIIILDLMMPDLDGFTLLESIRSDPGKRNTPVVILTSADLQPDERERLIQMNHSLLQKSSFTESGLLDSLHKSLNQYKGSMTQ